MNFKAKAMGRRFCVIACTMVLSGCALPVPFQIASWAIDGISLLATKKSLTDHGISMATQKDCALWRGIKGDEICSTYGDSGTIAVAAADTAGIGDEVVALDVVSEDAAAAVAEIETASGTPEIAPAIIAKVQPESKDGQSLLTAGVRIWSDRLDADMYYVIGSFSSRDNARRLISKHSDLGPAVMASRLDGVESYRVAVGPFNGDQRRDMHLRLKKSGISNAWAMRIDHQKWVLASPQELLSSGKSVAQVPAVSKPTTKAKPAPKQAVGVEIAETAVPENKVHTDRRHLVIGSFSKADNALNFARMKGALSPRIMSVETSDGWRERVIIGPYAKAEGIQVRRHLANSVIEKIWALNLNEDDIISDIMLAETPNMQELPDKTLVGQIAEILDAGPSSDEVSWGVNLVKNIFDMFRSSDTANVVGVVTSLKS
jgi:cell division protein FtsN